MILHFQDGINEISKKILIISIKSSLPFTDASLQFHGGTLLAATASAAVIASGCLSCSSVLSRLSGDLPPVR